MDIRETSAPHSLRHTAYATWLTADTAGALSVGVQSFAMPLLTLIITDSPLLAGAVAAATVVARAAASLLGGVLADRHDRPRLLVIGSAVGCLLSLALATLAGTGALTATVVIVATVILAFSSATFSMVREPMLRQVVPDELVGRAQASNQARDAALSLATGPLGGLLVGVGGWLVGLVMACCDAVAGLAALRLRRQAPHTAPPIARAQHSARRELAEAFRWLLQRRDLLSLLIIVTIINFGITVAMTTTVYALQQSGTSAQVIGFVSAAVGAGMLVGAVGARWIVGHVAGGTTTVVALAVTTVTLSLLTVVSHPVGIAATLLVVGLVMPAVNATLGGYMMLATPSEMLGRVGSASAALGGVIAPLAPLVAGLGLTSIGRTATITIGIALMITAVVIAVCSRPVRGIPTDQQWQTHADAYAV